MVREERRPPTLTGNSADSKCGWGKPGSALHQIGGSISAVVIYNQQFVVDSYPGQCILNAIDQRWNVPYFVQSGNNKAEFF